MTAVQAVRPDDGTAFVSLQGITKAYGPIQALGGVDLELRLGEVHCLAGENGAGKSTLIKVLTGAIRRDAGEYTVGGTPIGNPTPAEARAAGIGVVYQELSLLPDLSVEENLLMGRLPAHRGITRPRELRRQARQMLARVDLRELDPSTPVSALSPAVSQLVEIAKVLGQDPRVLIFDEPTTALSENETSALLTRIRQLRDAGHAIMYVSHHLEEMFAIGDRVTVLRDGKFVKSAPMGEFDHDSLIGTMVGRKIESLYPGWSSGGSAGPGWTGPSTSPSGPGRSSVSPACSAPGGANCSRPSSAATRSPPGRCGSTARRCGPAVPARPYRPDSACSPRTARRSACCWSCRSGRTPRSRTSRSSPASSW
jgi:ABC-type sugar transport system ATPase subunit